MSKVLVAIPMKALGTGKSRLAGVLDEAQRRELTTKLFERTHRFFRESFPDMDVLVVTPAPDLQASCKAAGHSCLPEPAADGLDAAAARAIEWGTRAGYGQVMVVPGDVLVWVRSEVSTLLACGRDHDIVIARAHDGGTNALLIRLPTRFDCRYGPGSAQAHWRAARQRNLSVVVCSLPFLARDLDTPDDLEALKFAGVCIGHRS